MEFVKEFLIEVTEELLYNIVYEAKEIKYKDLSEKFEERTGYRPMNFFGYGNITGQRGNKFIKGIQGLQGDKKMSLRDDDDDENDYKMFNTTYLNENEMVPHMHNSSNSVAGYREELLIKCSKIMNRDFMMAHNFTDLSSCKDANDNTPLHLIAGLPGIRYDCSTLVKYLLQAGVDPLAANKKGQNILHIILGRYKAEMDIERAEMDIERVPSTKWFVEDRVELLDLLSEELSQVQTSFLVTAQDKLNGNTVMHECALSSPIEVKNFDEVPIYGRLFKFGARPRVSNNSGETPMHYAFNVELLNIFLWTNMSYVRAKNDDDETPVQFILKYSADLAFAGTSVFRALTDQCHARSHKRSPHKALRLLQNLMQNFENSLLPTDTFWIPDRYDDVGINIILIAIRFASYRLDENDVEDENNITQLRLLLVELLCKLLRDASPRDVKRHNIRGQGFLHVLLDKDECDNLAIIKDAEILQSLQILLEHNVDVNAVDSEGLTPLDITYKHHDKKPTLYKICAELLIEKGGTAKQQTRKLRSFPTLHFDSAQRLTDPNNTQVTVVEKYRYSNQDPIGNGAFSSIFVAIKDENVDSRSGTIECRAYALKRIDKAKINPQEIKREITTLLSISGECENIIKCHESVEDPFFQYLCLDLMDGDLHEFVTNNGVNKVLQDPANGVQVCKDIINGLAFLHEKKFIHRDLKPGNILYTTDSTLHFKIADFGLTKNMSTLSTMTSTRGSGVAMAPGTRCWMAPELVSMKSREHTEQSDMFSLGLVLHYLLTLGKHPFGTENEERAHVIERNIEETQINIDKTLHSEAINFLQNILTNDPFKRPPAKQLTHHPFLWSETKKIEFLRAVGDQQEVAIPARYVNSALDQCLQMTHTGQQISRILTWDQAIENLFEEVTTAWPSKRYRTDKLIDLIRFIRNAYAHRQERSFESQRALDENIFLHKYPSLVIDVLSVVVRQLDFGEKRSNIRQALSLNT